MIAIDCFATLYGVNFSLQNPPTEFNDSLAGGNSHRLQVCKKRMEIGSSFLRTAEYKILRMDGKYIIMLRIIVRHIII